MNGTLFDPAPMAAALGGGPEGSAAATAIFEDAVTLALAETLLGRHDDFSRLFEAAAARRLRIDGREEQLERVLAALERLEPSADAVEALGILAEAGVGAGVLTNSSTAGARALLERAGLDGLAPVLGSERAGAFKPDRRVYEMAVAELRVPAAELVLVTAHWWDAWGARCAGLRSVWVARKEGVRMPIEPAPDHECADLAEAARWIAGRAG
jgi:2-haloacid dehalogenase